MSAVPPTSRFNSRGFTLVEVLMAMLIMTVGLLGLLQSVNVAYQHNSRNQLREEAVMLAEEQMNDFRSRGFDTLSTSEEGAKVGRVIAGGFRDFSVTRRCQSMGRDAKKLTVAVQWRTKDARTEHMIYTMKNR